MRKLILKDDNPKEYIVVELDNGICFVHNNKTGKNYFNQEAISRITGLDQSGISRHISRYKKDMQDMQDMHILLNVFNSRARVKFYDFDVVTYIVYRSTSLEAIRMRKYIADAIDEKFNIEAGFTKQKSLETNHIDVFEWECEVEDLQGRLKDTSNGLSVMSKRARLLEQNGDTEELERTQAVISDLSNEFTQISLLISNATETIKCFEKIRELSPKVTNSKYWGQNHLIPFKKS